jgi:hypothetical protein
MERVFAQFEGNNALNQLPGEKIKTVMFKKIIPELVKYIVSGVEGTNMDVLTGDYWWLDVVIFVCEECYLGFTKIFVDGDMREEFTKNIPDRDKVIVAIHPKKKLSKIFNIVKNTVDMLAKVRGKVDTGLRKHEKPTYFALGASVNNVSSNLLPSTLRGLIKTGGEGSQVIGRPTDEAIEHAKRENMKYLLQRRAQEDNHRRKQDLFLDLSSTKDAKFKGFLKRTNTRHKKAMKKTYDKNPLVFQSRAGAIGLPSGSTRNSVDPHGLNFLSGTDNSLKDKYKYGWKEDNITIPGWKPPTVIEKSRLEGWDKNAKNISISQERYCFLFFQKLIGKIGRELGFYSHHSLVSKMSL